MKKNIYRLFAVIAFVVAGILISCSDDSEIGTPVIKYIRITEPLSSDSLLVAAGQGQMVAIIGENLGTAIELWFNDQRAELNTTFIYDKSIIARVPAEIPLVVNDELMLKFRNGETLTYNFNVDISAPSVLRMKSEYVEEGGVATIFGNFFYEPLQVTFSGGVEGEIVSVTDNTLEVTVPAGAGSGPVTVASNFGSTESTFWFRDDRNVFASFDVPLANGVWRGPDNIVETDPDINNVSGKFTRVNENLGAWPFYELYGGPMEGDIGAEASNIPQGAISNPAGYDLKFEINTLASLTGATMRLHIGNAMNDGLDAARQSSYYAWEVNLDTGGEWQTVTIPWASVYQGFDYDATGYSVFIYFHGPNPAVHNFGLDNLRVVPNN